MQVQCRKQIVKAIFFGQCFHHFAQFHQFAQLWVSAIVNACEPSQFWSRQR